MPELAANTASEGGGNQAGATLRWSLYAIGLALLTWLILSTGPIAMLSAIADASWAYVAAGLSLFSLNIVLRAWKWSFMVRRLQPECRYRTVLGVYVTNVFFSNLTPANSGEALAPLLLAPQCRITKTQALAIVALDRSVELVCIAGTIVAAGWVLSAHDQLTSTTQTLVLCGTALLVTLVIGIGVVLRRVPEHNSEREYKTGVARKLAHRLVCVRQAIREVGQRRTLQVICSTTLVTCALEYAYGYCLLRSIVAISIEDHFCCQAIAIGVTLTSLIPGGIGIAAASYASVARTLGYDWSAVTAACVLRVFLLHGTRLILATTLGRGVRRPDTP